MPTAKNRFTLFLSILSFLLLILISPSSAPAQEVPPQDVVFLVDASESAAPYLPAITGILQRFVSGAVSGDTFTCYQFSNNPVLIAKGKVRRQSDLENLQKQILQLRDAEPYTNYTPAIEKGFAEILRSFRENPERDRLLILLTDGRSSDDLWSEKINLTNLLRTYSDIRSGSEYFFTCFYIGEHIEPDLQSFLYSAGAHLVYWPENRQWLEQLTLAEVRVVDREKRLESVPETPAHTSFSLSFFPRRAPAQFTMIELGLEEEFTQGTLDRLFDIRGRRIQCRKEPWSETFMLETRGFQQGAYGGKFLFYASEPQSLLVYPDSIPFAFSVAEALSVLLPEPLVFGPTGFAGDYRETKAVYVQPQRADFPKNMQAIDVEADISLPDGLRLDASPVLQEKEMVVFLTLSRDEQAPRSAEGEYAGRLKLSSPAGWTFNQREFPLTVKVQRLPTNYRRLGYRAAVAAGALAVAALALLSVRGVRRELADYFAHKARPAGKLIPMKDPTMGLVKKLNLHKLSRNDTKSLTVGGAGEGVNVEIPHISMVDKMFVFTGTRMRDRIETSIKAAKGADHVLLNGIPRVGRVPLKHLDHVKLGAFEFRYEEPLLLQQVVLYYLSGRVQHGWLLDWNIKSDGFRFLNRDEALQPAEATVRFYELKAVAFLRDFDGEVTANLLSVKVPRRGHVAHIIFADQEELTGYVLDCMNPADKFYLFPNSMGDNVLFLLIERHTLKQFEVSKEDEAGAKQARKQFEGILKRMSAQFGTNTSRA